MSDLSIVGDELRLDGEAVAMLLPSVRGTLLSRLEEAFDGISLDNFDDDEDERRALSDLRADLGRARREGLALRQIQDSASRAGQHDLSKRIADCARRLLAMAA